MALIRYTNEYLLQLISHRDGEIKLGTQVLNQDYAKRYSILCINEDIGVKANGGIGGTGTAIEPFLRSWLSTQSNDALSGNEIEIYGCIIPDPNNSHDTAALLASLDQEVSEVIQEIVTQGKTPIVIGGGHNNAYGIIRGVAQAISSSINVINCDPHADIRKPDHRHSGNGFSYAISEGFLSRYAMLGLHESYNNQFILDSIKQDADTYKAIFFEDIFIKNKITWEAAVADCHSFVQEKKYGVELDIDAITDALSSALTPVGISPIQAMQYLYHIAQDAQCAYLHLPEAIAERADGLTQSSIGKLLAYLVTTFIKGKNKSL